MVKRTGKQPTKKLGRPVRGARPIAAQKTTARGIVWRFGVTLILAVSLACGLLYGGHWLRQRLQVVPLGKMDALEQVEVRGVFNAVHEVQLKEILLPYLQAGFFSVDIRAMQSALLANPWVTSASVRRRWPRGVLVEIAEAQPLAVWGGDRLLVASGALLPRPAHMHVKALPELAGDELLVGQIMTQYQALAGILTSRDMEVKRLSFDDLSGWRLELVSGIELKLGHDALLERVNRFLLLSRGLLAPHLHKVAGVDTRYGNAVAVQWKNGQK
ncbi:cell division protein FtsQ/DivIB [Microbulbifer spongiae]|uniref:Cell division protein FtsQ n=1 Tax=Microbulbifer spongiae TaxID=2944933 RepID=A0ABY9E7I6_9GAMM|nr:FtsQ-type POTRA domain-containing protein [Microbulbifer sp. MI-G]WKD48627.1 FtsQ-type POTRA domain-containing protein [Microbulbifer sp. MI-G]